MLVAEQHSFCHGLMLFDQGVIFAGECYWLKSDLAGNVFGDADHNFVPDRQANDVDVYISLSGGLLGT